MGTDIIIPEIQLVDQLEKLETTLSPALWQQMRTEIELAERIEATDKTLPPALRVRKKMSVQDFVNKAISLPLEITPCLTEEVTRQLYRLHLFCCQRVIHCPEIKRNPFQLGFKALEEMKMALVGIMISYRLIEPSCPYSWNREFFERNIVLDKGPDGHTTVTFCHLPAEIVNKAVNEELITDWLIYRAYDNNGIRTLMDFKNNLLTLPDYLRGGHPSTEFSRFERKMAEERNRRLQHRNQELDLEFRKTLVHRAAEQTASQMIAAGMSATDILTQAFADNLSQLTQAPATAAVSSSTPTLEHKGHTDRKKLPKSKNLSPEVENMIAAFLKE